MRIAVVTLLGMLLAGGPAAAAPPPSRSGDSETEVARRHFETGRDFYDRGDYAGALREFEIARLVKPLAALDFNIARCHERLGQWAEAIAAYQRFAAAEQNLDDAEQARDRIRALKLRLEETHATATVAHLAAAPPAAAPPPRERALPSLVLPAVWGGVALAVLGAGLGLTLSAGADYQALQERCAPRCSPSDVQPAQAREQAGVALLAIGGVALAADVLVALLRTLPHRRTRSAWLAPAPGGLGVGARF